MGRLPSCSICIDKFSDFADISACPCGHTFHRECLAGWVSHSAARGQPPSCPTCAKPFENRPAMGVIQSLYFSFDADGLTPEFHDEFLAKQMDHNENLTNGIAARDAEIRDLRAQLASSRADLQALKETTEKEKKALETQLNTKHAIAQAGLQGVITHLRGELATSQADLKTLVDGFKVAEAELKEIKKQPSPSAKRDDDCSCHIVISNLSSCVHPNALRARLAKWQLKDFEVVTDGGGIGTAYVSLLSTDDAHEVIERLHGVDWYGQRMIVRHAIGEKAQVLKDCGASYKNLKTCASSNGNQWRSSPSSPGNGADFSSHNAQSQQASNICPAPQPTCFWMPPWLSPMPLAPQGPMMFSVTPQPFQQWRQS